MGELGVDGDDGAARAAHLQGCALGRPRGGLARDAQHLGPAAKAGLAGVERRGVVVDCAERTWLSATMRAVLVTSRRVSVSGSVRSSGNSAFS